jgi:7,8-dihydropterin-6-yl-methyl-4-(beta-D-ribofuranosyl)aminobenzene 5'-phosphate synthase
MNKGSNLDIYVPQSFSKNMKNEIKNKYPLIEISAPQKICDGVYTTGELGTDVKEQSLVIKTKKGLLVVTGCAHPELDLIIKKASAYGHVYGILGGFHGFNKFDALINLELIVPCHCTKYKKEIKELYPNQVELAGVGYILNL